MTSKSSQLIAQPPMPAVQDTRCCSFRKTLDCWTGWTPWSKSLASRSVSGRHNTATSARLRQPQPDRSHSGATTSSPGISHQHRGRRIQRPTKDYLTPSSGVLADDTTISSVGGPDLART
ncbi:hypothetical protein CF335_g2209 [Tilletia laevis]|nr:hypothetical protein CF335_g2209 [Tilletia laevis]